MTGDEDQVQVRGDSTWGCAAMVLAAAIGFALVVMACAWGMEKTT